MTNFFVTFEAFLERKPSKRQNCKIPCQIDHMTNREMRSRIGSHAFFLTLHIYLTISFVLIKQSFTYILHYVSLLLSLALPFSNVSYLLIKV